MKIKIGSPYKPYLFSLEIKNGEIDFLFKIETENRRWIWLAYNNAKHNARVWNKDVGQYHFCLQIPYVIMITTAYCGKKSIGRLNLTRLFKKDYHVYSNQDECETSA